MSVLDGLLEWYRAQCDGEWEHAYGIVIETLDNPGWLLKVDLRDTILEGKEFVRVREGDSDNAGSWIDCRVEGFQFRGAGDPTRLEQIIRVFLDWAKARPKWLGAPDEQTLRSRDDRELWEFLGRELASERCRVDGCNRWRIRHSIYCRFHHFEYNLGRPAPFPEDAA